MKAIILAAGRGERLRPLTDTIPKPLVPIKGMPLLEYNLLLLKHHGVKEVCINTSYLAEQIKNRFGDGSNLGINICYSFEKELLGTSGALNNFRDKLNETFYVIYGDNLTDIDLTKFLEYHRNKGGIATLAVRKKEKEYKTQSLIFADDDFKITTFLEKPTEEQVRLSVLEDFKLINSGIYILEPKIFNYIPSGFSDFAYDIFPKLIESGLGVYAFIMNDYYFREVGKIEKYEIAKGEIESGKIKLNFIKNG